LVQIEIEKILSNKKKEIKLSEMFDSNLKWPQDFIWSEHILTTITKIDEEILKNLSCFENLLKTNPYFICVYSRN
jgi:hypothetical protein